ncbi:restriction endonuclease subunit S [Lactococcus cremoris]|uniref:restriction endonuclease subunit S n=1 Tax=Lactococcus lactis subsp. cremoris TaxID=1359 RepID=UPI00300E08AD
MMSKKSPQLRFEGFTDDWEERKLGDVLSERNDQTPETNEYPLMSFVQGKGVTPKGERYNRSFLVKDSEKKYKKTELGDFIYSSNNLETGSIGFNRTGKAVISPVYSIFESKKSRESQFIGIMSARKDFISKMVRFRQGVVYGQWRIHESDFLNIDMKMPNDKEQQLIISFFENIDKTIALHQRKLDLLKEQKKGYLQKMFPKNGAKVPELRFVGFADDWEQRKLEELGNLNRGKSKHRPRNDSRLFGGEYPFIQTGDVAKAPLFLTEYSQTYSEFGIQQSKLWDIGTLLITIAANIADTTILGIKAAFPDSVIGFESTSCDVVFIKNYIDIQSDLLKRKAETSSQANLNLAKLKEMNLNIPKLKEQQKIGSFFKQLDDTIALHQRKLDLLKEQKKGFLQKMFV